MAVFTRRPTFWPYSASSIRFHGISIRPPPFSATNIILVSSVVASTPSVLGATLAVPPTYMAFSLSRARAGVTIIEVSTKAAARRRIGLLLGRANNNTLRSTLDEAQAVLVAALDLGDPADLGVVVASGVRALVHHEGHALADRERPIEVDLRPPRGHVHEG